MHYLWPVSRLWGKGYIHHIFDGESRHGTLSEGNDLIDAFHHGVQRGVGLQRELSADLKTEEAAARVARNNNSAEEGKRSTWAKTPRSDGTWLEY